MARQFNRIEILGTVGGDPEMRFTPSGQAITNYRVCCTQRWRDDEGRPRERTEWFRICAHGAPAELANQYLDKGSLVLVTGYIETRSYEASDGQTRYVSEVVQESLILLPRANETSGPDRSEELALASLPEKSCFHPL